MTETYIASLDVGTTTIRCHITNSTNNIVGSARSKIKLLYPEPGQVEINPYDLFERTLLVIKDAIIDANLSPEDIKCIGISTQRSSFITWRKDDGSYMHNFITWKDIRAEKICQELNSSLKMKSFRLGALALYPVTRNQRYLTGSRLKIAPSHVTGRLIWAIRNVENLKEEILNKNIMFGTIDTWLLYKLTKPHIHLTDLSNASATGFFDPYSMEWGTWAETFLGIPQHILPQVVANDFDFGTINEELFGHAIPISCVISDQSSSMFASCSFEPNDVKLTLGTGAFWNVNTGSKVPNSVTGSYPVIGWKLKDEIVHMAEIPANDCGSVIEWLIEAGLIEEVGQLPDIISSVSDSDGVSFIPAFSGFGDAKTATGFLGIKPTTTKAHLVRAVIEGIAHRVSSVVEDVALRQRKPVVVDGGVANSDFICQLVADTVGLKIQRLDTTEMSVLGVAYISGLKFGVWQHKEQLSELKTDVGTIFEPTPDLQEAHKRKSVYDDWTRCIDRFTNWYL